MSPLTTPQRTEKKYVGTQLVISCSECSRSDSNGVRCPHCLRDETIGQFDPGSAIVEVRAERAGIVVDRYPLVIQTERGAAYPKSPDGHTWGYSGSGPSQLALDVLWDVFERQPHPSMYHAFKDRYIASTRAPAWGIYEEEVRRFVADFEGQRWALADEFEQETPECPHEKVVEYEDPHRHLCCTCGSDVGTLKDVDTC